MVSSQRTYKLKCRLLKGVRVLSKRNLMKAIAIKLTMNIARFTKAKVSLRIAYSIATIFRSEGYTELLCDQVLALVIAHC